MPQLTPPGGLRWQPKRRISSWLRWRPERRISERRTAGWERRIVYARLRRNAETRLSADWRCAKWRLLCLLPRLLRLSILLLLRLNSRRSEGCAHTCLILHEVVQEFPLVILFLLVVDFDSGALERAGHAGDAAANLQSGRSRRPGSRQSSGAWGGEDLVNQAQRLVLTRLSTGSRRCAWLSKRRRGALGAWLCRIRYVWRDSTCLRVHRLTRSSRLRLALRK